MFRILLSCLIVYAGLSASAMADKLDQKWLDQRTQINPLSTAADNHDLAAYDKLRDLAIKQENPVAMHNMGWLYNQKIDFFEQYRLLPSKNGKYPPSGDVYEIYVSTAEGEDPIRKLKDEACLWWKRGADAGYPYSQISYAGQCLKPRISKRGSGDQYETQMISMLKKAAEGGRVYAAVFLSDYLAPWPHPIPKDKSDLFWEIVDVGWNANPSEGERSQLHGNVSIFKAHHDVSYVPEGFLSVADARDCYKAAEENSPAINPSYAERDERDLLTRKKDLLEVVRNYEDQKILNSINGEILDLDNCEAGENLCQTTRKAKSDHDDAKAELVVLQQHLTCSKRITNAVYNDVCSAKSNEMCKTWR